MSFKEYAESRGLAWEDVNAQARMDSMRNEVPCVICGRVRKKEVFEHTSYGKNKRLKEMFYCREHERKIVDGFIIKDKENDKTC